jgi:hypothetical protein
VIGRQSWAYLIHSSTHSFNNPVVAPSTILHVQTVITSILFSDQSFLVVDLLSYCPFCCSFFFSFFSSLGPSTVSASLCSTRMVQHFSICFVDISISAQFQQQSINCKGNYTSKDAPFLPHIYIQSDDLMLSSQTTPAPASPSSFLTASLDIIPYHSVSPYTTMLYHTN